MRTNEKMLKEGKNKPDDRELRRLSAQAALVYGHLNLRGQVRESEELRGETASGYSTRLYRNETDIIPRRSSFRGNYRYIGRYFLGGA